MNHNNIPAEHFCTTLAVNVDNDKLSDADFRQFVRNTLPIVNFPAPQIHTYTKEQPK
jgi:hypothetical protein